jgi:hypothetical protein
VRINHVSVKLTIYDGTVVDVEELVPKELPVKEISRSDDRW